MLSWLLHSRVKDMKIITKTDSVFSCPLQGLQFQLIHRERSRGREKVPMWSVKTHQGPLCAGRQDRTLCDLSGKASLQSA